MGEFKEHVSNIKEQEEITVEDVYGGIKMIANQKISPQMALEDCTRDLDCYIELLW